MRVPTAAWRVPVGFLAAATYTILTNPFVLSGLMVLPYLFDLIGWSPWWLFWRGHFTAALILLGAYTLGCIGAVLTSRYHQSPLTGQLIRAPERGTVFWIFGNDQDGLWLGWHRSKYPKAMRWIAPFMWTWWRNTLRNLSFVPALKFLHAPPALVKFDLWTNGKLTLELWWSGWMTELKASKGRWFIDLGPRLDQPAEWGTISWAFRLGKS